MRSLTVVFILFASPLSGQDARDIVNRYLDTVSNGNIDNWNKIRSTYTESEVYYSQQDFEQKVDFLKSDKAHFHKSYRVPPYHHKIEIYEDSTFTKMLSAFYFLQKRTILLLGNIPPIIKPAPPPEDDYLTDHVPVRVWKLLQESRSVELLGVKHFPVEGLQCYEVKIAEKDRTCLLYINTATFLLEYYNRRKDGDMSFLVKFSDYKKIDDFLIPMSDYSMRNGIVFYWRNIRKIEINADIGPEVFEYNEK